MRFTTIPNYKKYEKVEELITLLTLTITKLTYILCKIIIEINTMVYTIVSTHKDGVTISIIPKAIYHGYKYDVAHDAHWSCKQFSTRSSKHIHTMGFSFPTGLNGDEE